MKARLALLIIPALLTACGRAPSAPVAPARVAASLPSAQAVLAKADDESPLEKPVTARNVLNYGHAVARLIDPKAAFCSLVGTRIGVNGTPVRGGEWQLSYVGTQLPAAGSNPYQRATRRISLVVPASGQVKLEVNEQEGLPLGLCFMDAPVPAVDSDEAMDLARKVLATTATSSGYRLTLQGLMGAHYSTRLVWKVVAGGTAQGADRPLTLDATSGDVIQK